MRSRSSRWAGRTSCLGCPHPPAPNLLLVPGQGPRRDPCRCRVLRGLLGSSGEHRRCLGATRDHSQEKTGEGCAVLGEEILSLHEQERHGGPGSGSCWCPAVPKQPLQALPRGRLRPVAPCWARARRGRAQGLPLQCHRDPGGSPRRHSLDNLSFTSTVQMFPLP